MATDSPHAAGLPSPAERPDADIVIYDGQCNFCRASVARLPWWDCQGRLCYVSLHDPSVAERWPDIALDRLHQEMCIVEGPGGRRPGRRHWGAEAVRHLTFRLRRLWWLMPLMHLPGMMLLARPLYRLVARNRYRIAGRAEDCDNGSCSLPR
ncbi:MAG: DUF393 domain-containing protein [Planctomycetota bacterium]